MRRLRAFWTALRGELEAWWYGARYVEADHWTGYDSGARTEVDFNSLLKEFWPERYDAGMRFHFLTPDE